MIRLASTSHFLRELPLTYETVIRNSVLNACHEEISNQIYTLLHGDKQVQNIDLPSPLCLLRIINTTRCECCNEKARGLTLWVLFCDSCGEEVMGSELHALLNPTDAKFWRALIAHLKEGARADYNYQDLPWYLLLDFYPREVIHASNANAVATLRQVYCNARCAVSIRVCLLIGEHFWDLQRRPSIGRVRK